MFQVVSVHPVIDSEHARNMKLQIRLERVDPAWQIIRDGYSALWYIVHVICLYRLRVVVAFSLDCLVLCG